MVHPYKSKARDSNPKWLKGLDGLKEGNRYKDADAAATLRTQGGNPAATAQAAYAKPVGKKGK